jgi:hypothetical protein
MDAGRLPRAFVGVVAQHADQVVRKLMRTSVGMGMNQHRLISWITLTHDRRGPLLVFNRGRVRFQGLSQSPVMAVMGKSGTGLPNSFPVAAAARSCKAACAASFKANSTSVRK